MSAGLERHGWIFGMASTQTQIRAKQNKSLAFEKNGTRDIIPGAVGGGDISQAALPVQASAGGGGKAEGRKQATTSPHRAPCSALGSSTEKGERSDATQRDVFGVTRPFDFRPPF